MNTQIKRPLTIAEAAEYLSLKVGTLRNKLSDGSGPKSTGSGRMRRFYIEDLDKWLDEQREAA